MTYHINEVLKDYKTMLEQLKLLEENDTFHETMYSKEGPTYQIYTIEFINILCSTLSQINGIILEVMAGDGRLNKHLTKKLQKEVIATDNKSWSPIRYPDWVIENDALGAVRFYNPKAVIMCWEPYGVRVGSEIAHNFCKPLMWIGEGQGGCCGCEELFMERTYIVLNDKDTCLGRTDYGFKRKKCLLYPSKHTEINLFNWPEDWLLGEEGTDWCYRTGSNYERFY